MMIRLRVEHYPIKAGWAAFSPEIGLTSGGRDKSIADANLVRTATSFFRAYARGNSIDELIKRRAYDAMDDGNRDIAVELFS